MSVDFVVGEVGFGSNIAPEAGFYKAQCDQHELQIKDLEARIDELTWQLSETRRVLQKCAALTPQISDEKHEVLLKTDPKNYENAQENP